MICCLAKQEEKKKWNLAKDFEILSKFLIFTYVL